MCETVAFVVSLPCVGSGRTSFWCVLLAVQHAIELPKFRPGAVMPSLPCVNTILIAGVTPKLGSTFMPLPHSS